MPLDPLRRRLLLLLTVTFWMIAQPAAADPDLTQLQLSTVRIVCKTDQGVIATGSGFVVANDRLTYIATNAHVVTCGGGNVVALVVLGDNNTPLPAQMVWDDTGKDLAIISVPLTINRPAVTIADTTSVNTGDPVIAIGFPGAADEVIDTDQIAVPTVTKGNIERVVVDASGMRWFQHSASITHGNSGGPLFNQYGQVIGINSEGPSYQVMTDENGQAATENVTVDGAIGFSIDIGELLQPLRSQGINYQMASPWPSLLVVIGVGIGLLVAAGALVAFVVAARRGGPPTPVVVAMRAPEPWPQAGRRGMVKVTEGYQAGLEVPVSGVLVIGRDPAQAQLVYPAGDEKVSRRHCEIRYDPQTGLFDVRDCGSTNGTFITEGSAPPRRLAANVPERLAPGKKLQIGTARNVIMLALG